MHTVYLLQSERFPSKRYIGITTDIKQRIVEHNQGKSPHTSKFRPWKLKVPIWFDDSDKAVAFEQYLKRGSTKSQLRIRSERPRCPRGVLPVADQHLD